MIAIASSPAPVDSAPIDTATVATLGHALVDALNVGRFEDWFARLAPDYRADHPGASGLDAASARAFNDAVVRAFADLKFAVEQEWTVGDTHVVICSASGSHVGTMQLPSGVVPPTGRTGVVRGTIITTTRDGMIVHEQTYWNQLGMLTQLDLVREFRPMN